MDYSSEKISKAKLKEEQRWDGAAEVHDVFLAFVEARAVSDFHYKTIQNHYPDNSPEFTTYKNKINELTEKNQWIKNLRKKLSQKKSFGLTKP